MFNFTISLLGQDPVSSHQSTGRDRRTPEMPGFMANCKPECARNVAILFP